MVVLDTSVVIDFIEGDESVLKVLEQFQGQRIAITIFTEYEIARGENERNSEKIRKIISTFEDCEFDKGSLGEAVKIYKDLERRGKLINEMDILIAAASLSKGEILLTRDNDFKAIGSSRIRNI